MGIIDGARGGIGGAELEADVIVSCVLLGFLATRILLHQPVQISVETFNPTTDPEDFRNHQDKIKKIKNLLSARGYKPEVIGDLPLVSTPHYKGSSKKIHKFAITGSTLGPGSIFIDRHRPFTDQQAQQHVRRLLTDLETQEERGAYYGVIDDPVTHQLFNVSSVRRIIGYRTEGGRWESTDSYHGLIGGMSMRHVVKQAGSVEPQELIGGWTGANGVVGYCHGMIWAIQKCKEVGPWTTPYEIAIGTQTTKLASCFACTTFMYATGYPPSAIHLGRGESWVPLPPKKNDDNPFSSSVTNSLNKLWANDVVGYLTLGATIVCNDRRHTKQDAQGTANRLYQTVQRRIKGRGGYRHAANLFLDALTIHKKDIDRLASVLR